MHTTTRTRRAGVATALGACTLAASAAGIAGRWEGTAAVPGAPLPIVLDLEHDGARAGWFGSVILPGRGVKGAPLAALVVEGDSVRASLAAAIPSFGAPGAPPGLSLTLQPDGRLAGEFTLAGHRAALSLRRSGAAQPDLPQPNTPLAAALGGVWRGSYELFGQPRQVTLTLTPGPAARADLVIVGRRTTQVPIDRIVQGERFLLLESGETGLAIEGRWHAAEGRIEGQLTQGPVEVPLVLVRDAAGARP